MYRVDARKKRSEERGEKSAPGRLTREKDEGERGCERGDLEESGKREEISIKGEKKKLIRTADKDARCEIGSK